jgi:flagellar export protein FliJ
VAEFRFRLASVLRFRERIKQEKEWELALLNETRRKLEGELYDLEHQLVQAEAATVGEEGGIYSALDLQLRGDYARLLVRRVDKKRAALAAVDKELAGKREELVEMMRGVKMLEQLRRRLEEKFRNELNIADQKFRDETGLRKFAELDNGQKLP